MEKEKSICGQEISNCPLNYNNLETEDDFLSLFSTSYMNRFMNFLIDSIIVLVIHILVELLYYYTQTRSNVFVDYDYFKNTGRLFWITQFLYYLIMEGLSGRTIGKYLTNTVVIDAEGNKPDFKEVLIRTLCRFIPFEPISLLLHNRIGWHDMFSKTRVVDKEELESLFNNDQA